MKYVTTEDYFTQISSFTQHTLDMKVIINFWDTKLTGS